MIWTMTVGAFLPESMLSELDGLVIAGMGTGSISEEILETLSPWTSKIPIVVTSRCERGQNFDDYYYKVKYSQFDLIFEGKLGEIHSARI